MPKSETCVVFYTNQLCPIEEDSCDKRLLRFSLNVVPLNFVSVQVQGVNMDCKKGGSFLYL